jgi:hypothetical protein
MLSAVGSRDRPLLPALERCSLISETLSGFRRIWREPLSLIPLTAGEAKLLTEGARAGLVCESSLVSTSVATTCDSIRLALVAVVLIELT